MNERIHESEHMLKKRSLILVLCHVFALWTTRSLRSLVGKGLSQLGSHLNKLSLVSCLHLAETLSRSHIFAHVSSLILVTSEHRRASRG